MIENLLYSRVSQHRDDPRATKSSSAQEKGGGGGENPRYLRRGDIKVSIPIGRRGS